MYKPAGVGAFATAVKLQKRIATKVSGALEFTYEDASDPILNCNFKTYGGTETVVNGSLVILNTATLVTWYRQDIQAADRILLLQDNSVWEVLGEPENIDMRNQYLILKIRKISGGA